MTSIELDRRQYLDVEKLALSAFAPVSGFMNRDEWVSVVETMRLPGGEPFTLPVALDVERDVAARAERAATVSLRHRGRHIGELAVQDVYSYDKRDGAKMIFGTDSPDHPGVRFFLDLRDVLVGGRIQGFERVAAEESDGEMTPAETRRHFEDLGWQSVVGFQTRNVPHRAHEYLQRVALEQADGLFIQPLVGRKKAGDFAPDAVLAGYRALVEHVYPPDRVLLSPIRTAMWYAGPREAVFHAILRRNYGCTHFIVGRDHAGVGDWYGTYAAHELTRAFDGELGIEVIRLNGPYHCTACETIVTDRTCRHAGTGAATEISGTWVRSVLQSEALPPAHAIRREVVAAVRGARPVFVVDGEE